MRKIPLTAAMTAFAASAWAQGAPLALPGVGAPGVPQAGYQQPGAAPQGYVPAPQGYVQGPQAAPQMPQGMVPVGQPPAQQAGTAPQPWVPGPGYAPPPGYAAQPVYVQPNYPPPYAPPGYVPAQPPPPPSQADLVFQQALGITLPLTNGMTRTTRRALDADEHARSGSPSGASPHPQSRSISLSLRPGERAPVVHLAPGNASTLTFSDQTGAAWPVNSVTVGNPQAYAVQEAGEKGKTNMVVISPLSNYGAANLVVTLAGLSVPVMLSLDTGRGSVDYWLAVGVPGRGPNAQYDVTAGSSLAPTNDATVQGFLDGIAPRGARKVKTSNRDVEAWRFQDMVYVRSPLELVSPAYVARAHHVSGVNVYTMADAPVVLFSQDGRLSSVNIER